MEYAGFEGIIPEGNYGAGTVMVWDAGTYDNLRAEKPPGQRATMEQSFKDGKIEVRLEGKKLHGDYALIRTGLEGRGWLIFKMKDEFAEPGSDIEKTEPDSVLTGRTMEQIRQGKL